MCLPSFQRVRIAEKPAASPAERQLLRLNADERMASRADIPEGRPNRLRRGADGIDIGQPDAETETQQDQCYHDQNRR